MRTIEPQIEVLDELDGNKILKHIEQAGRVCYKSEDRISEGSSSMFIQNIINRGHESVLEHEKISVRIICDRGVSHEIVRHRIASYSQESTRYCNYAKDKFGKELTFIKPCFWEEGSQPYQVWEQQMQAAEDAYHRLISLGAKPEEARTILPNSLKTELVMTMNIREWRHFFKLRTSERAHPQMREIARMLLEEFRSSIDLLFDDV